MPTRYISKGFTLIEMILVIVVTAILMAMAAPLIVHLADSYEVSAEGADLASAVGPAIWQIQWDARNSNHLSINAGKTSCTLILRQSPSNSKIKYQYDYATGEIFQRLPGVAPKLILAHLTVPGGRCPFAYPIASQKTYLATYAMRYQQPGGQGRIAIEGALTAYARP
jgi:prepilin-type N-terminal cleavage/methylation domain-containing protein